jgi:hypothetical protein
LRKNMLWSTYYISVIFNKEIFNNSIFEGKNMWGKKYHLWKKNHNSFKIYVSGEVIKNIESSNETQKTNVLNQTNKIKCTYAANIEW